MRDERRPIVVFPIHDPEGLMLPRLAGLTAELQQLYARAVVSMTPPTDAAQPEAVREFAADPFWLVEHNLPGTQVGDHFLQAYRRAVEISAPEQRLHLCVEDRLCFALQTGHHDAFVRDVTAASAEERPVLFMRSPQAWATHPRTYQAIESMATRAGEVLLGRSLDFAWCYLVIGAAQLRELLPRMEGIHNFDFLAEMVYALRHELVTRDVDWLAWEKPFIVGRDPGEYRRLVEADPEDHEKRLAYTLSMVRLLLTHAREER